MTNPASISVAAYRAAAEASWQAWSNGDDPTPEEKTRRRKAWRRIMDAAQELIAESDDPTERSTFSMMLAPSYLDSN